MSTERERGKEHVYCVREKENDHRFLGWTWSIKCCEQADWERGWLASVHVWKEGVATNSESSQKPRDKMMAMDAKPMDIQI